MSAAIGSIPVFVVGLWQSPLEGEFINADATGAPEDAKRYELSKEMKDSVPCLNLEAYKYAVVWERSGEIKYGFE